ncbi:hypothetical protein F4693_002078 [Sphingomonas endophytica]|uniref:Uncharacterized protein n=1 Tax=Sphingomonas endophytica TaxID=869719 RepID=A0A7X0JEK4_9SPHN|nr:hypothetical protein [Sphingomonas endophytica]MBB6505091.1 hypothetical protein [Sphingomonas endophytica]
MIVAPNVRIADREDAVGERRTRLVQRFVHHGTIMLDAGRST